MSSSNDNAKSGRVIRRTPPRPLGPPVAANTSLLDRRPRRMPLGTVEQPKIEVFDHVQLPANQRRDALAEIPQPVLVFAAHAGTIEYANPAAEDIVGVGDGVLVGRPIAEVLHAGALALEPGAHARFLPVGNHVQVRYRDGRIVPVAVLLSAVDDHSTMAIVYDPAACPRGAIRSEHVAQIVHDLKNPLATIGLEALVLDGKLAADAMAFVDLPACTRRIRHNVEFLDRMVRDLLDSCSIDAGTFAIHREPTDLRTLLECVVDRAVPTRDRTRVFLEAPQTITLAIDDLRIQRVVANLLGNALAYTPRHAGIVIRLELTDGGGARISVIDSGPGLSAAECRFVFDRYRRAASSRGHDGSGLGLCVSKSIVEAHGGRIAVDSVHGTGARFFFDLPRT